MGTGKVIISSLFLVLLHGAVGQSGEDSTTCRVAAYYPGAGFFRQVTNITIIPPDREVRIYPVCCPGYVFNSTITNVTPDCDRECPSGSCIFGYCPPDDEKINCKCYDDNFYPRDDNVDCIPVCSPSEDAEGEGECTCHAGYSKDEKTNLCVPTECIDRCTNGRCDQFGTCTCDEGFVKHAKRSGLCVPNSCAENCFHGTCTTNGTCTCDKGYLNINEEICEPIASFLVCPSNDKEDAIVCKSICDTQCINGTCTGQGACNCNTGYKNSPEGSFTCAEIKCPSNEPEDVNFCKSDCESKCGTGKCSNDGSCNCVSGYKKSPEDRFTCNKISCPSSDSEDSDYCKEKCNSICVNGSCSDEGRCTCATPTEEA